MSKRSKYLILDEKGSRFDIQEIKNNEKKQPKNPIISMWAQYFLLPL